MHLSPRDIEKLMLHNAGFSRRSAGARRAAELSGVRRADRRSRVGIHPRGQSVAELMDLGRRLLGRRQVIAGVAEMIVEVQVEGTFPDGTKLVTVHHPVSAEDGDPSLAALRELSAGPAPVRLRLGSRTNKTPAVTKPHLATLN